ncbi:MAG: NIL domain-containing protein [Tychonema bourrellyi B0820]|uniref:ABC transporter n=1 Tax=Tychonema bourrellyi FEM_GT703 TaxID=2040638 RepID=A0A2G4F4S8_9CYAN|nr:NIL domain-containing protein [Tychonema bourrellyi]MDQ2098954.1 NIL domain-containing protein [Tychonema bourrellyi B0820]PHX56735.1 ABC transporter [Tychonema bourrellyi FEM_GT703]
MLDQNISESEFEPIDNFHKTQDSDIPKSDSGDTRQTQTRIRIRVPKEYHQEPVISNLISEYGLTVNFNAALLGVKTSDDGWFDLELNGTTQQIDSALIYLNDLDVEIWSNSNNPVEESW